MYGHDGARHVEHAGDVGVEHGRDVVVVERRERIVADDAGVVDQDVDAPGALGDRARPRPRTPRRRGRRPARAIDFVAGRARGRDDFAAPPRRCRDRRTSRPRPRSAKSCDDRAADAAAAAGDEYAPCRPVPQAASDRRSSSRDAEAAVDDQRMAVDHRRFRQAQQVDGAGDVLRRQHRARRRALREVARAAPRGSGSA